MRATVKFLLILLSLLAMLAARMVEAKGIGMVLDVRGTVSAEAGGKSRMLEITDVLDADTRILVGKDGEVSFVFYPTREQYTAVGPTVLRLEAKLVKALQGAAPKVKKLSEEKTQVAQAYNGRVVPAALVMKAMPGRKMPPRVIYPAEGELVLETNPEFAWSSSEVPVSLVIMEGDNKLVERAVADTRLPLSTDHALVLGHKYRWSVEVDGHTSAANFKIATDEQRQQLAGLEPTNSAPLADWVIYAMAMEQAGAVSQARRAWERIEASRPASDKLRDLSR